MQHSIITEEGFHTILQEYGYTDRVIKFLWAGRPEYPPVTEGSTRMAARILKPLVAGLDSKLESDGYAT